MKEDIVNRISFIFSGYYLHSRDSDKNIKLIIPALRH